MLLDELKAFIDTSHPLHFRDVLDLSLAATQAAQAEPTLLYWLEITFQVRPAGDPVFIGIVPCTLLLATQTLTPLSPITFGAPAGQPQPLDWARVWNSCRQFNRNVPGAAAVAVARFAVDETRKNSTYYRLLEPSA